MSVSLFGLIARHPWPFATIIPIVLLIFAALGWSRDDKIENNVANMWSATRTRYHHDKEYMHNLEEDDEIGGRDKPSSFAGMAVSRDRQNLFTQERLDEIIDRMAAAESTVVEYHGNNFSWPDLCFSDSVGPSTTYQFPCFRLSPMDYFQQARMSFTEVDRLTWRDVLIHKDAIGPLVPQLGTMMGHCITENVPGGFQNDDRDSSCDHYYKLRTNVHYARSHGFPDDYVDLVSLVADIANLELSDQCSICIQESHEKLMEQWTEGTLALFAELQIRLAVLSSSKSPQANIAQGFLSTIVQASALLDRNAVEEFHQYFSMRQLYAQFGAEQFAKMYSEDFMDHYGDLCDSLAKSECPRDLTTDEAAQWLLQHTDAPFSSVNTGGLPLPFWNLDTGYLMDMRDGKTIDDLKPFGGSGLDFSGGPTTQGQPLQSLEYFDMENIGTIHHKPLYRHSGNFNPFDGTDDDEQWALVTKDPIFVWFLAAVTPMTSHCGNDPLPGTHSGAIVDKLSTVFLAGISPKFCTPYDVPFDTDGDATQLHFAKMWYDLVIDSPNFLDITRGVDDPYTWTSGEGCGYEIRGSRFDYTGRTEEDILQAASGNLYYLDEGKMLGPIDRNILMGDTAPPIGEYDASNPLQKVGAIQTVYPALTGKHIINRVKNCNRPGGPIYNLTEDDTVEIMSRFKKAFEDTWSKGWDDDSSGEVQFVGLFDDNGGDGTTGRMLKKITLSSGTLMVVSILIIAIFSAVFLASRDPVESRILVTLIGVALVIISFFSALGIAILAGIKINITIGWTLPFIVIGLGVDDMYIVSVALRNRNGHETRDFIRTMNEVLVPVTMTSLVNFCMFAVMNMSDIPAVFKTAQAAMLCVFFLWFTVVFCFPAYCWLDMKRQRAGRADITFRKVREEAEFDSAKKRSTSFSYEKFYKPLMIKEGNTRKLAHSLTWAITFVLLFVSIFGYVNIRVGLGLEDFFPSRNQASVLAQYRTEHLATWPIMMNWGQIDYTDTKQQIKMMKQFEAVMSSPRMSNMNTDQLWIAQFAIWTTRLCDANFLKQNASQPQCGHDQIFAEGETCAGTWVKNTVGLRVQESSDDSCDSTTSGVCRTMDHMHPSDVADLVNAGKLDPAKDGSDTWCPVFEGWSEDRLQFCIQKWRQYTGKGRELFVKEGSATENPDCANEYKNDHTIITPIPLSSGPIMYGIHLYTHEDTLDLIEETRAVCDEDEETHCFMSGVPYDYWEQYIYVKQLLVQIVGTSIFVGYIVSAVFLFAELSRGNKDHSKKRLIAGSLFGALIIAGTCLLSSIAVIGLSAMAGVTLTALSDMSFVLSIGFVVEYAVHITHRFMTAPAEFKTAMERVEYTMEFLFLPTFMSFVSSTIGVACLAFTNFKFNRVYFFRPLIIVMFVTYFLGCFFLPVLFSVLDLEILKLGKERPKQFWTLDRRDTMEQEEARKKENLGKMGQEEFAEVPLPPPIS